MQEFKDAPPDGNESSKWFKVYEERTRKGTWGQSREGLAHGIAFIGAPRKYSCYMGTFVNGKMHGYGVLHFGHWHKHYYEGEF